MQKAPKIKQIKSKIKVISQEASKLEKELTNSDSQESNRESAKFTEVSGRVSPTLQSENGRQQSVPVLPSPNTTQRNSNSPSNPTTAEIVRLYQSQNQSERRNYAAQMEPIHIEERTQRRQQSSPSFSSAPSTSQDLRSQIPDNKAIENKKYEISGKRRKMPWEI